MLLYENFISELFKKRDDFKLAIAFVNFFKTMLPEFEFNYIDAVMTKSPIHITIKGNNSVPLILMSIQRYKKELLKNTAPSYKYVYYIKLYHRNFPNRQYQDYIYFIRQILNDHNKDEKIEDYMFNIFNQFDFKFNGNVSDIISKLTKENFDDVLFQKELKLNIIIFQEI